MHYCLFIPWVLFGEAKFHEHLQARSPQNQKRFISFPVARWVSVSSSFRSPKNQFVRNPSNSPSLESNFHQLHARNRGPKLCIPTVTVCFLHLQLASHGVFFANSHQLVPVQLFHPIDIHSDGTFPSFPHICVPCSLSHFLGVGKRWTVRPRLWINNGTVSMMQRCIPGLGRKQEELIAQLGARIFHGIFDDILEKCYGNDGDHEWMIISGTMMGSFSMGSLWDTYGDMMDYGWLLMSILDEPWWIGVVPPYISKVMASRMVLFEAWRLGKSKLWDFPSGKSIGMVDVPHLLYFIHLYPRI